MLEKLNSVMSDISGRTQYSLTKLRLAANKAALEVGSNLHLRKTEFGMLVKPIMPKKEVREEEERDPEPSVRIKVTKKDE